MTTAKEKITKAKARIINGQSFFATLVLGMQYKENEEIKTAQTDGKSIEYNPGYINSLTDDQTAGLLCHEILHPAFCHHTRRANRDPELWNKACDYAINPIVKDAGFILPDGALIDARFFNKSAEQIFKILDGEKQQPQGQQNKPDNNGQGQQQGQGKNNTPDPGKCGAVKDAPIQSEAQKTEEEARQKRLINQAKTIAEREGKLPDSLKTLIDDLTAPSVNWREVLARFLTENSKNDYSWTKPNPRYLSQGIYLPALYSQEIGPVYFIVDTSESMSDEHLRKCGGEIADVCSTFNKSFTAIYVDTKFQGIQEIEPDAHPVNFVPIGGGGTDFRPGFNYIDAEEIEPACVIYLTDGECNRYPETPPAYPVLWAVYNKRTREFNPPFGEVIKIE